MFMFMFRYLYLCLYIYIYVYIFIFMFIYLYLCSYIYIYIAISLTSSNLCTIFFTWYPHLQSNLDINLPKCFNSVIVVQLIISLCSISSFMYNHLSFKKTLSLHLSLFTFKQYKYLFFSSLHREQLPFLHLFFLYISVSKFPVETTPTLFSPSYCNSL